VHAPVTTAMTAAVTALDLIERGDWAGAHEAAQSDDGKDAAWVHAHLHRVEGDIDNARYWYAQAGRPVDDGPLDVERAAIAEALRAKPA